jgi:uroporphyrinogen-III synthase
MHTTAPLPLAGRGILITRPAGQAEALAGKVTERGGRPILFPVIEIADVEDTRTLATLIDAMDTYDLAIFVSPTAVSKGWAAIHARRRFPAHVKVAAVGQGSARALQRLGVAAVIAPSDGADSESLLSLPELQSLAARRIVIFRGGGGRELLRQTLVARGATVDYAECYRRTRPADAELTALARAWHAGEIDAAVITSSEGLRNLWDMLDAKGRVSLVRTPIFVPHPRIAQAARELQLTRVTVTGAGDDAMVQSLSAFFSSIRGGDAVLPKDSD